MLFKSTHPRLVILAGPTAVGKTTTAIKLSDYFDIEIINADSIQVYRKLNIGSAKPTLAEQKKVPFHLIDIIEPWEEINAVRWAQLAKIAIADIHSRGKYPLISGGAGFYIKSLLFDLVPIPAINKILRENLQKNWQRLGGSTMYNLLKKIDPISAYRLYPADRQRIIRALEVTIQTKRPFSNFLTNHHYQPNYNYLFLGLTREKTKLNTRIEQRCKNMWQKGLIKETEELLAQGLTSETPCLKSLGYRQAISFIKGNSNSEEALNEMINRTKSYAKRQTTWFRQIKNISWLNLENENIYHQLTNKINFFYLNKNI